MELSDLKYIEPLINYFMKLFKPKKLSKEEIELREHILKELRHSQEFIKKIYYDPSNVIIVDYNSEWKEIRKTVLGQIGKLKFEMSTNFSIPFRDFILDYLDDYESLFIDVINYHERSDGKTDFLVLISDEDINEKFEEIYNKYKNIVGFIRGN